MTTSFSTDEYPLVHTLDGGLTAVQEARIEVMRCLVAPDEYVADLDADPLQAATGVAMFADPLVEWVMTGVVPTGVTAQRWDLPAEPTQEVTHVNDRYGRLWLRRNGIATNWVEADAPPETAHMTATSWANLYSHCAPLTAAPAPNQTVDGATQPA